MEHTHNWKYSGHIIRSTDLDTEGKFHFECSCGADLYAERLQPGGRIFVKGEPLKRYRNPAEKAQVARRLEFDRTRRSHR